MQRKGDATETEEARDIMITASMLFAGERHISGPYNCYYCGAPCTDTYKRDDYVKDTFTNRDIVVRPASEYVCVGCVESVGDGRGDMPMIDGSVKTFTTPRGMAPRLYSWLLTQIGRFAFTKGHIPIVREMLTNADLLFDPPFAWVLSDSGQKQLIFRAPVAYDKAAFSVMLEDRVIHMTPDGLRERVELAGAISSKLGKPVLSETVKFSLYAGAQKAGLDIDLLKKWNAVKNEPLSQLAAWLAPPKEKGVS